jgi:hypothetical protein
MAEAATATADTATEQTVLCMKSDQSPIACQVTDTFQETFCPVERVLLMFWPVFLWQWTLSIRYENRQTDPTPK